MRTSDLDTIIREHIRENRDPWIVREDTFTDFWYGEEIIHRDEEVTAMLKYLADVGTGIQRHLVVAGNAGTGKTYTARLIHNQFLGQSHIPVRTVYIDCTSVTPKKILYTICNAIHITAQYHDPFTAIQQQLKHAVVIIIDNIAKVDVRQYFRGVLDKLASNHYISFMIIVHRARPILQYMTRKGLYPELGKLMFRTYTADEIYDLLCQRITLGLAPHVWSDELLHEYAQRTCEILNGDMRSILSTFLQCTRGAYENTMPEMTREYMIRHVTNVHQTQLTAEGIDLSDPYVGKLLDVLTLLSTQVSYIYRSDLYGKYLSTLAQSTMTPKSDTWFYRKLIVIQQLGLIHLDKRSRTGKPGLELVIRLLADRERLQLFRDLNSHHEENE